MVLLFAAKDTPQASPEVYIAFKSAFRGYIEHICYLCWNEENPSQRCPEISYKLGSFFSTLRSEFLDGLHPLHMSESLLHNYCEGLYERLLSLHKPCWCGATFNCSAPQDLLRLLNKSQFDPKTGVTLDESSKDPHNGIVLESQEKVFQKQRDPSRKPSSASKRVLSNSRTDSSMPRTLLAGLKKSTRLRRQGQTLKLQVRARIPLIVL